MKRSCEQQPPAEESEVMAALVRARQAWPALSFDEPALTARLSALGSALPRADVEGLALVQACLQGIPAAVTAFEQLLSSAARSALARLNATPDETDEIVQRLRLGLLVPGATSTAKLSSFSGRGSLRGWLQAVAAQEHATFKRSEARKASGGALAEHLFGTITAPDVRWIRAECREAFRAALEQAVDALPEKERLALKMSALDGLSIDEIGRVFGMHRSTAARWLVRARSSIVDAMRESLARQLGTTDGDLTSVVRFVDADIVTLEQLFGRTIDVEAE